jgi:RNA polymerase sigma-70 factor (ECF subfamily)
MDHKKMDNAARSRALREMADEELMAQLQQGVEEALEVLVERYSERLSFYLRRFLRDEKQVQDLLQETFLRVYRNRYSYEPIAKFSTWLYTIAGNLARSEYRRRKRHRTFSIHGMGTEGEEYELPIPAETPSPHHQAERGIHRRAIHRALDRLPEEFREVVVLRDIQQLSYEEIAEITGLPLGTVKSRINRGRARLQEMLKDVYSPYSM